MESPSFGKTLLSSESSDSSDSVEDLELADPKQSNLRSLNGMGLSASLASLYSGEAPAPCRAAGYNTRHFRLK